MAEKKPLQMMAHLEPPWAISFIHVFPASKPARHRHRHRYSPPSYNPHSRWWLPAWALPVQARQRAAPCPAAHGAPLGTAAVPLCAV